MSLSSSKAGRALLNERPFHSPFVSGTAPLDKSIHPSPFRVAIKDNIAFDQTTCGSNALKSYKSHVTATSLSRLRKNGRFQFIGKTRMDEFGMGSHSTNTPDQPVHNAPPYELRSAGGSSGGSAVAVAENECDVALGSDTGGSVRLPAAYMGVIGFKPSYGRISRHGLIPYANSLDTIGLLSKNMNTLRQTFKEVDGSDPQDPTCASEAERRRYAQHASTPPERIRIGIPLEYNISELHPEVRIAWQSLLSLLSKQNYSLVPISLPNTKPALPAYYVLAAAEASSNLAKYDGIRYGSRASPTSDAASPSNSDANSVLYAQTRGLGLGAEVKRRILLGSYTLSSEAMDNHFIQAQRVRRLVQRDFDRVFAAPNPLHPTQQFDLADMPESVEIAENGGLESKLGPAQVDIIIVPTAPTRPPLISEVEMQEPVDGYMNDVFTVPASLAGLPAISVPVGIEVEDGDTNVPFVGMQIMGQYWDDERVVAVGEDILRILGERASLVEGGAV